MADRVFKVNVDSIDDVKNTFNLHNKNILESLLKMQNNLQYLDEIYYTKTSQEYKNILNKVLDKTINKVNSEGEYYNTKFNEIAKAYSDLKSDIGLMVQKDNS